MEQTAGNTGSPSLRIGVDVGGTFTDLVASDGANLHVVKVPSTPPDFHLGVIDAVRKSGQFGNAAEIIHGSTVATNALLQRAGAPIAFVTTEGFADMLLIGRQNRPNPYALKIVRPEPLAAGQNVFTVRERISAQGDVVEPLDDVEVDRVVASIRGGGLEHVAVCLLFSFINPIHERQIAKKCAAAGLTVSLSSEILPEFREYERASTTAVNAALLPTVRTYLEQLQSNLPATAAQSLQIIHSGGGTLRVPQAIRQAARLVLSGPAGGVLGAGFIAREAGCHHAITYDMGGTSTDVAVILDGQPQWTTATTIDGLPIGLPMFDIHTVGAGGGSVAYLDTGGALRVGPRSAGARPGPACYNRGGIEPTVTDANLVLGRILPDHFLGGAMRVEAALALTAIEKLSRSMNKSVIDTALGIVKVAEANMEHAIRQVTSRRGHDPRGFTLVSFGGAGGLHACALADALDIPQVLIPPYCGVLSALGMVVAPPVADASRTVVHLGDKLDDNRLIAEFGSLSGETIDEIPYEQTDRVEVFADVRFQGQSHEVKVKLERPMLDHIDERFIDAYRTLYGNLPSGKKMEVVTLRVRRYGRTASLSLPRFTAKVTTTPPPTQLTTADGHQASAGVVSRADLVSRKVAGPLLIVDPEATTYVPPAWQAEGSETGIVTLARR